MPAVKITETRCQSGGTSRKYLAGGDCVRRASGMPPGRSTWSRDRLKEKQLQRCGPQANPLGDDFNCADAFDKISAALKKRRRRIPDRIARMLATRRWPLRPTNDSYGRRPEPIASPMVAVRFYGGKP
jgi:hypothetical protein